LKAHYLLLGVKGAPPVFPQDTAKRRKREVSMPRYYFHLTDGKEVLTNHKGLDLPGNAAAREEALVLARDLKQGKVMPGWNWDGWLVSIVDQHGHKVDSVPITAAP
jgi:hypothetical protein